MGYYQERAHVCHTHSSFVRESFKFNETQYSRRLRRKKATGTENEQRYPDMFEAIRSLDLIWRVAASTDSLSGQRVPMRVVGLKLTEARGIENNVRRCPEI